MNHEDDFNRVEKESSREEKLWIFPGTGKGSMEKKKRESEKVMIFELDMEVDNRGSLSSCIATWGGGMKKRSRVTQSSVKMPSLSLASEIKKKCKRKVNFFFQVVQKRSRL